MDSIFGRWWAIDGLYYLLSGEEFFPNGELSYTSMNRVT